jgi:two-component system NarL family sensor kinase
LTVSDDTDRPGDDHGRAPTRPPSSLDSRDLAILNAIAAGLNASVDLDSSLRTALLSVAELLGLRTGWVFLLDEETAMPRLAATQALPPGLAAEPHRMAGSCYCLDTYGAGDLRGAANVNVVRCSRLAGLIGEGVDDAPMTEPAAALTSGLRYHASIPLYARGRRLGILNVASPDWRELSPEDLRLLYTVGDLLAIAIERARLYARSSELGAAEERNRIAREIHDTLAQGLAGIALQLETADALLETGAEHQRIAASVRRALEQARSSLEAARHSVLELRRAPLDGRSLGPALHELVAAWREQSGMAASLETSNDVGTLPARIELGMYGIAREALSNVAQHSSATRVRVALTVENESLRLLVEDDGRGFDAASVPTGRYGLIGMNERARLLGGRLHVESAPGKGTRIVAEVPA